MSTLRCLTALVVLSLAACATNSSGAKATASARADGDVLPASAAVPLAAEAAPRGVRGTFRLVVRGSGHDDLGIVYLNSEEDYRDQRCLTVALHPDVVAKLAQSLGAGPEQALKGKTLLITGQAFRMRIDFINPDGSRSDKYYYQTHLRVLDPRQITIEP